MKDKKILVPIDFGEQSLIALELAKFYAKRMEAKIVLLYVVEESGFLKKLITPDYQERIEKEAEKALKGLAAEKLQGFEYEVIVEDGKAYEEIEDVAEEIEPVMIVMGKTEKPTLAKRILGSNTLHVIQESDFPVVSVRGEIDPQQLTELILLPLDLAKPYKEQLNAAIEYAKFLNIKKIFAMTVDVSDDVAYETQVLTGMHKVKKAIESEGLEAETEIVEGKKSEIVEIIRRYTEELKPMLTVIAVHDEIRVNEIFIGSIAKQILEKIDYPILSIKPWDAEHKAHPIISLLVDPMSVII